VSDYLSPDGIAQTLGVPKSTVYLYLRDRHLPAFKVGKHWRIRKVDLEAWIDKQIKEK